MATLRPCTDQDKEIFNKDVLQSVLDEINVNLTGQEFSEWHEILASLQSSIKVVEELPDYKPEVDLDKFPRQNVHLPSKEENSGNAWACLATVEGTKEGSLKGFDFCLKDNISLKNVPMMIGTDVIQDHVPDVDATVVTRILENGGTIKGKAVCENLSLCASSFSAVTGPVENPYADGYTTGGSSSGCGHLVGAHQVRAGIGADQGGSIRFPSSYCGIVGMKPTWGLVPYTGIMTHEPLHDVVGPMTSNVRDNALVLQAIAGRDEIDERGMGIPLPSELPDYSLHLESGVKGMKIGVLKEAFEFEVMDPRVAKKVKKAIEMFKELGAEVIEVSMPMHKIAGDIANIALRPSAAKNGYLGQACARHGLYMNDLVSKFAPFDQEKFDKLFPTSKFTLLSGEYLWKYHPTLYGKAMNLYRKLRDEYDTLLEQCDIFITPTTPYVANTHANPNATSQEKMAKSRGVAINTVCFNASGHPAMSIPCGMLSALEDESVTLPVGMQIVGKKLDEQTIYRVANAWESKYDWKKL